MWSASSSPRRPRSSSERGLSYKSVTVTSNKPVGTVLSQDPAAAKLVKPHSTVKLTVSGQSDVDHGAQCGGFLVGGCREPP